MSLAGKTFGVVMFLSSWTPSVAASESNGSVQAPAADVAVSSDSAEAAFERGLAAAEAGDWKLALASFLESEEHEPAPGTRLNIARCREALGQNAAALAAFERLVSELPADDERSAYARSRLPILEPLVSRAKLSLPPDARSARVFFDGAEVPSTALDTSFPVEPGEHEVVVTAPGRDREIVRIALRAAESHEVLLEGGTLKPRPVTKQPTPLAHPVPERPMSVQKILGFGGLGLGAVGLAVGGITGVLALDRKNTMEANCDGSRCTQEGLDASDSGEGLATASTVAFGAGLVFAGVGASLLYFDDANAGLEAHARGDGGELVFRGAL
jgi:hypothetical protein